MMCVFVRWWTTIIIDHHTLSPTYTPIPKSTPNSNDNTTTVCLAQLSRTSRLYYGVRSPEHLAYADKFDSWKV